MAQFLTRIIKMVAVGALGGIILGFLFEPSFVRGLLGVVIGTVLMGISAILLERQKKK
jgi:uncharacterized membrane protein